MCLVLSLLLVGCQRQARIEGTQEISRGELEAAARRPLASWQEQQRNADLVDAAAAMRERLDARGFVFAEIDHAPPAADDEDKLPRFTVREGVRVAITQVEVRGDRGLDAKELIAAAGFGPWLTTASVQDAPSRILRTLRRAGHLRARVLPAQVEWNAARDAARISIEVVAGPRFVVSEETLDLVGDQALRPALTALLDRPGVVCHPRLEAEIAARVRGYLADRGWRDAVITTTSTIDEQNARQRVHLTVTPGLRQVVSAVTVEGGRRTSRNFVDRQLRDVRPGQPLSQSALDAGMSSLTLTGLYRRAQVETLPGEADANGDVPTTVKILLAEQATKRVDLSVGYGSYEQVRGGAEYIDDHLFGRGLRFNVGANSSLKGWGADTGLQDPYLLGPGRRIGIDVTYSEREEPAFSHQEGSATLAVSQKTKPRFDPVPYEGRMTYEFSRSLDFDIGAPLPGEEKAGEYTTSAIGFSLRRDSRSPRIVDPEAGTYTQIGSLISAKPLGADVQFVEVSASWSFAVSPGPWMVATVHVGAKTREPLEGESLPIGERLFLGGEDSVRSFTKDDLGPRDADGTPTGGLTRAVGNLELRWRPFFEHRAFEIATFYDLGMVDPEPWHINGPAGQAIGAGFRYRTPVGPIRLDYGYNPGDRLGAGHPWAIHLAVGFAF
jgi:outer membrane protein assembly factor BamA